MMVDVDKVVPNPQQPRRFFDEESLAALAESLRTDGLLNPIGVIGPVDGLFYILEDGERRLRAARLAGWAQIEASVKAPDEINDTSFLMHAMVGNLQREEMGPVDEARAFEQLNVLGLAHSEIGRRVGKSQSYISSRIRMLQFPVEIQDLFNGGFLPIDERVMYALRRMPEEAQIRAAKRAATMRLDASRILALCSRMMATAPKVNSKAMIAPCVATTCRRWR